MEKKYFIEMYEEVISFGEELPRVVKHTTTKKSYDDPALVEEDYAVMKKHYEWLSTNNPYTNVICKVDETPEQVDGLWFKVTGEVKYTPRELVYTEQVKGEDVRHKVVIKAKVK